MLIRLIIFVTIHTLYIFYVTLIPV